MTPNRLQPELILQALLAFCRHNLHDTDLSPRRVAAHFGISVRTLHLRFQRLGQSFGRWLLETRLDACSRALCDPYQRNCTVSEIAYRNGFTDLSHFQQGIPRALRHAAQSMARNQDRYHRTGLTHAARRSGRCRHMQGRLVSASHPSVSDRTVPTTLAERRPAAKPRCARGTPRITWSHHLEPDWLSVSAIASRVSMLQVKADPTRAMAPISSSSVRARFHSRPAGADQKGEFALGYAEVQRHAFAFCNRTLQLEGRQHQTGEAHFDSM